MTAYQVMPPLTPQEMEDLYSDIEANGVRVPVDVDEDGNILDGHHRVEIANSIGIGYPIRVLEGLTEEQKIAHAYAVNLNRRSLNREQKRTLVAASLRRDPELSDRQHADRTGVSHPTVASVRSELVESGDVENLSTRTDSQGRQQPAHVTTTTRVSEATKVEHNIDLATGEILDGPREVPRQTLPEVPSQWRADAADRFLRMSKVALTIRDHMDALAEACANGSDLERRTWIGITQSLADHASALAYRVSQPTSLRSVK